MENKTIKTRKPRSLSPTQVHLLKLLYKFRYATTQLLSIYTKKTHSTIHVSMRSLLTKGYVTRKYSSNYKLAGRSAEYYLSKQGIKYLRDNFGDKLNEQVLKSYYKNPNLSESFIRECLNIFNTYNQISSTAKADLRVVARAEFAGHDDFPRPLPCLFVETDDTEYFLDIFTDKYFFPIKRRLDQYVKHYEDGEWGGDLYPTMIILAPSEYLTKKTLTYAEKLRDDNYYRDEEFVVEISLKSVKP